MFTGQIQSHVARYQSSILAILFLASMLGGSLVYSSNGLATTRQTTDTVETEGSNLFTNEVSPTDLSICGLGFRLDETEGGAAGVWTRRAGTNIFDAVWPQSQITAVVTINMQGNNVTVARRQSSDGNDCDYVGAIAADGITMQGTYQCSRFPPTTGWQATIRCPNCSAAPANMVAWWRGEGNAYDSIGNNNGTLLNGASFVSGMVGQGFNLNGNTQYVVVPHSDSINPTAALTVETWVNVNSLPTGNPWSIVTKDNPAGGPYDLTIFGDGRAVFGVYTNGWQQVYAPAGSIVPGNYAHLAGTYESTTGQLCLYVNGVPTCGIAQAGNIPRHNSLKIGGSTWYNTYVNGIIDEVSIYNRALSATEIQSIYNAGSTGKCAPGPILAQTINQIEPNTVTLNTRTKLVVHGTNFSQPFGASVVTPGGTFNIGAGDLTYISPTEIHVWVHMGGATGYTATLNLNFIRGTVSRAFSVVPSTPAPVIDNMTPSVIANQVQTLTINGTNFKQNFKAFIISPDCPALTPCELLSGNKTHVTESQVKVNVVMQGTAPYNATVKIQNPDGQSATAPFQVLTQSQPPPKPLKVLGIEVTQAVQDMKNSVILIQGKSTYVRVHVKNTNMLVGDVARVRAKLIGTRIIGANRISLGERDTIERTVKVEPSRSSPNDSYLFALPTDWTNGTVELRFEGVSHDFDYREPDGNPDGRVQVTFETAPNLKIKLVSIYWENGSGEDIEPNSQELAQIILDLRKMLPAENIEIERDRLESPRRPNRSLEYFYELNLELLRKRRSECGQSAVACREYYLGIISPRASIDVDNVVEGMASAEPYRDCSPNYKGDVASGYYYALGDKLRYNHIHEFGHLLGRFHTRYTSREGRPCTHSPSDGTIGGISQPPYSDFAIFGFDGYNAFPSFTPDVMSYGNKPYISRYTYEKMLDHIRTRFDPLRNLSMSRLMVVQGENVTLISGNVTNNEQNGEVSAIYKLSSPTSLPANGTGTYRIAFFDTGNQEIASYPFEPEFGSEGDTGLFALLLPHHPNAVRMSMFKGQEILASKQGSPNPPVVMATYPNGGETITGPTVNFQWTASDADSDSLKYLVQYSSNAGSTWQTLASDLTATNYTVSLDSISGTAQGLFRVIASDGFYSATDQSNGTFSINTHAPQASISAPVNNSIYVGDQNFILSGNGFDLENGQLSDGSLVWSSSLEGSLGSGQNLSINAGTLLEGTHVVTLTAVDSDGQTGTATTTIRIYRTQPAIPATLSAAPVNLSFIAQQGTTNLTPAQILAVRNDGDGTINWSASLNQPWIQLGQTSGTAPSNPEIRVNPTGLALGNYSGTVIVTTPDATNSPQSVNVSLTIVSYPVALRKTPFDFDGDQKTDLSIFRPGPGEWWWLRSSDDGNSALQFGNATDTITASDFTGDGKTDVAFWRPSTGQWFVLRSEDFSFYAFPFGSNGDIPVPADYDGDNKADAAVFRPGTLTWFISKSTGGTDIVGFGAAGDKPIAEDFDGDGKADIAVFRPTGANGSEWWIRRSSNLSVFATQFGASTDKAVAADYTGDGKADAAFWRPSTGEWYVLRSEDTSFYAFPFGTSADTPVPGDYDGDGKTDAGVFRPSNTTWYVNRSAAGVLIQQFGSAGDVPLPNAFVR